MSSASFPVADVCMPFDERIPELLHSLSTLTERGYGSRATLKERIKRGEIPAVRVGNIIKIRDRDLRRIAVPVMPEGGDAA